MEIVALNKELRHEFSLVLKLLRPQVPPAHTPLSRSHGTKPPAARPKPPASANPTESAADPIASHSTEDIGASIQPPSTFPSTAAAAELLSNQTPQQLVRIDRFKQHCLTVAHRLNTYQYGTKQAFCQEIAQLLLVARTPEQQQALQQLSERVADIHAGEANPATQVYGSLAFDTRAEIPSLQEIETDVPSSSSSSSSKKWLCNVNIKEHSITIGTYLTRENALKAYELFRFDRSTSRGGTASVYKLAEQLAVGQPESDEKVLQAAKYKCHSHVSWQRLQDLISLPNGPVWSAGAPVGPGGAAQQQRDPNQNGLSTPSKATQRGASSPSTGSHASLFSPTMGLAVPSGASSSSSSAAKGKNPKRPKKSADRLSHLRLRRLIQKRLCPHLKSKEVCVVHNPSSVTLEDKATWTATGRLEEGKVFSYKHEQLMTFADFVAEGMRNPVSACPHIFLVKTRESIDDHLRVCDTFSDAERLQLGQDLTGVVQSYMKSPEPKASRRR